MTENPQDSHDHEHDHEHEHSVDPGDLMGVLPESPAQLRAMVADVLATMIGSEPEADEDGDFPIGVEDTLVFVRVPDEQPIIELHAPLLEGVTLSEQTFQTVGELNAEVDLIQFFISEGNLVSRTQLLASPFVRLQLVTLLEHVAHAINEIIPEVQNQVGGTRIDFEAEG